MKNALSPITAILLLLICGAFPANAQNPGAGTASAQTAAQSPAQAPSGPMEYKMVSGFKQPFNDDLKDQTSKGWVPVGGVSVTSWNNDLYFAQLLARPMGQGGR